MIFPEVNKLYKYQAYNVNSMSALINKVSWAAKPSTFNDPFDCAVSLIPDLDSSSLLEVILTEAKSGNTKKITDEDIKALEAIASSDNFEGFEHPAHEEMCTKLRNKFVSLIQDIGVISLSELDDHILMWSHYADQHQGFCVEYNRDKNNSLGSRKTLPVRYTTKLPIFTLQDLITGSKNSRREYLRSLVLSKANEWNYEREWRYIDENGNRTINLNSRITAIIFGARMPDSHKATLIEIVNKYYDDVKFKQVVLKNDGFGLEIVKYHKPEFPIVAEPEDKRFRGFIDFNL